MTKRTRNIILTVIGLFILTAMILTALTNNRQNIAGQAVKSDMTVIVNDVEIPSYNVNSQLYIVAENLRPLGLSVERSGKDNALYITSKQSYFVTETDALNSIVYLDDIINVYYAEYPSFVNGEKVIAYAEGKYTLIPLEALNAFGAVNFDGQSEYSCTLGAFSTMPPTEEPAETSVIADSVNLPIIVLDPGHGKSSDAMSDEERDDFGWVYNSAVGGWGEWRHFKYGTLGPDCCNEGCSHRVPPNGACWYPIENGDRDIEPEINLNNCLAAKAYLKQLGYTVRLTRESNNENPSITRRLTYCYPANDISQPADAEIFVCIHSNAGGGSGSSYIALEGPYDQPTPLGSSQAYVDAGNALGEYINNKIGSTTLLKTNPPITNEPELIAFCKAPVICGYMEIGFFDNASDLEILNSSSDAIGNAIASGIDDFVHEYLGR